MTTTLDALLEERRPKRADARRNFDALVVAARDAFAEQGLDASLEEIAKRAGVGIGTLYRNFPTREALIEAVYVEEVATIARYAGELDGVEPREALTRWLERFAAYVVNKKVLLQGLNMESTALVACRGVSAQAATPLLEAAQAVGAVRDDVTMDDVIRLLAGVLGGAYIEPAQRELALRVVRDGLFLP